MANLDVELYRAVREDAPPTEITLCNRQYTIRKVIPVEDPTPETFTVRTLTGLVDYLKSNVDGLWVENLICHVASPLEVMVFSGLHGDFRQRSEYIRAESHARGMKFNSFLDAEAFNIWLQSCFVDTPLTIDGDLKPTDKGLILKYVGNVREELVKGTGDDGVSQEITVKSGIASVKNVVLPNPVVLRPYRTFNEVEQPASSFVFRAQEGPKFALIEADNGAWESEAMKNIKAFMEFEVPGLHVIA